VDLGIHTEWGVQFIQACLFTDIRETSLPIELLLRHKAFSTVTRSENEEIGSALIMDHIEVFREYQD